MAARVFMCVRYVAAARMDLLPLDEDYYQHKLSQCFDRADNITDSKYFCSGSGRISPPPITLRDIIAARQRIAPWLSPTPVGHYPLLDQLVGRDVRVLVKHENHNPVNSFKVRNELAALTALALNFAARGVAAASTGNPAQGVAFAGNKPGVSVTLCVPCGNNLKKNAAIRASRAALLAIGAR